MAVGQHLDHVVTWARRRGRDGGVSRKVRVAISSAAPTLKFTWLVGTGFGLGSGPHIGSPIVGSAGSAPRSDPPDRLKNKSIWNEAAVWVRMRTKTRILQYNLDDVRCPVDRAAPSCPFRSRWPWIRVHIVESQDGAACATVSSDPASVEETVVRTLSRDDRVKTKSHTANRSCAARIRGSQPVLSKSPPICAPPAPRCTRPTASVCRTSNRPAAGRIPPEI